MTDWSKKPFIEYLNAVDGLLEETCGKLTDQRDFDEVAASQEAGDSPDQCAKALSRRLTIRALNDLCRTALGAAGRLVQTQGICALPLSDQSKIRELVETFDDFTEDNDPYGEHEFGAFEYKGNKIFWKIDCYDPSMQWGSEDPTDPKKTTRVLTILLAEEW